MRLLEFLHVKPGKGAAFVRTKIKNLVTGGIQEKTFRAGETIVLADVAKAQMQYTYSDGDLLCFMNMETFEEVRIRKADIPNVSLMKEGKRRLCGGKVYFLLLAALERSVSHTVLASLD